MTELTRLIRAPRSEVYAALLDPEAVRRWMVPDGMTSEIHEFDPVEGGTFRISLHYDEPTTSGKTSAQTDTFSGRFLRLVPDTEVVQTTEFETDDPALQGEMTIAYRLASELVDDAPATRITGIHEGLPPGVSEADNNLGWTMSMDNLAHLVEHPPAG